MSYSCGSTIVKSGLVMYLDAGSTKSYVGSGTAWNDLSGNGNNGTLTNGPTFNTGSKGNILFDATDDTTNCGTSNIINLNVSYSLQFWVKPSASTYTSAFASANLLNRYSNPDGIYMGGSSFSQDNLTIYSRNNSDSIAGWSSNLTGYLKQDVWKHIALSAENRDATTLRMYCYLNGKLTNTIVVAKCPVQATTLNIGQGFGGNIGMFLGYNKTLSVAEVLQNYNATKGRYNL